MTVADEGEVDALASSVRALRVGDDASGGGASAGNGGARTTERARATRGDGTTRGASGGRATVERTAGRVRPKTDVSVARRMITSALGADANARDDARAGAATEEEKKARSEARKKKAEMKRLERERGEDGGSTVV